MPDYTIEQILPRPHVLKKRSYTPNSRAVGLICEPQGLTGWQMLNLVRYFTITNILPGHHCCRVVDKQIHQALRHLGIPIYGHQSPDKHDRINVPPRTFTYRYDPVPNRHKVMVNHTRWLVAFPRTKEESTYMWTVVNHALKRARKVILFHPDGGKEII